MRRQLQIPRYEVKDYPKDSLEKVRELFSQAFGGRTISLDMLEWQMSLNPCVRERAVSLWDGETLVAYTALTPSVAFLYGKEDIVAVSGTTMADPHYMGCSLQLYSECSKRNNDITIIYGFPNRNSYPIAVKCMGHHYVGDIAFWISGAKSISVSERIQEFDEFCKGYEDISVKLSSSHLFIKKRQKDYLNWRFFMKPEYDYRGFEYEGRGYIIVNTYEENGQKQLQIVDILADSDDIMVELLRYAINTAYQWDCDVVKLWLTSGRFSSLLKDNGFTYGEHPFPLTIWNQELDIANSYITMADSDIF